MLRTAAARACALPAARLAPTALPHARSMALGREEGEDVVVKLVRTRETSLSWAAGGRRGAWGPRPLGWVARALRVRRPLQRQCA